MKVFRYENRKDENSMGWIYMGDVDTSGKTTFGQILPTDRISHDYPEQESDCEQMQTAKEAGLTGNP